MSCPGLHRSQIPAHRHAFIDVSSARFKIDPKTLAKVVLFDGGAQFRQVSGFDPPVELNGFVRSNLDVGSRRVAQGEAGDGQG